MIRRTAAVYLFSGGLAFGPALGAEAPSPVVSDAELAKLLELYDSAQDGLMARLTGMTDEQWTFKPRPERWSVAECVEHITRAEDALLASIQEMLETPPDPEWHAKTDGKLALLEQYVPNRGPQGRGGVQAPEEIRPTEQWSRRRGITEFYATHGKVRSFVETMRRDIKDRTLESTVPVFNWLNGHDRLHSLGLHIVRHTRQIAEVQADPGYPAKPPEPAAAAAPDPRLTEEELVRLVQDIEDAQDTLLAHLSGLTDEQWAFKQNPDRWSIGECVEHIARGERVILGGIEYALSMPPNPQWYDQTKGKLDFVRENVLKRTPGGVGSPFRAPYEVSPNERWDRARGIREFYASHGELRAFVETMPREIKNRTFLNPFPQFGMLNAHDWLTLTAMHVKRHTMQIIEVQEDPNYPKRSAPSGG
jgi:uncharacterized damage-inducible protein DinB